MNSRRRFNGGSQQIASVKGRLILLLSLLIFFAAPSAACSDGTCQVRDSCAAATDCSPGLYCGNCAAMGKNQPFCIRGQATIPTSIMSGLPFNKYSWLVTHNSFSIVNAPLLTGPQRITFTNQEDSVTNQLLNGVRGFMLDMYDFEDDIWLCHSFNRQCFNITAFEPAINTLREIESFLSARPYEIVTIIIEDYVHKPRGLSKVFSDAGLDRYKFPVSEMPTKGHDWPTVDEMVAKNYRLLVFTSDSSKETAEGIAYQWNYMVENEPGDPGLRPRSCTNRKESKGLDSRSASLFLMNYFPTIPVQDEACKEHSTPLSDMVKSCYKAAGNLMPNFVAVNFYMRSDGGGVFDDLDQMNGQSLCGCNTITACKVGQYGVCKDIAAPNTTPGTNNKGGTFSGSVQMTSAAAPIIESATTFYIFFLFCPFLL
ncbi:unnamed protein product [Cuscuta campestris]|uniref:Phosphatidylinositol-specific phospholipase C X domain-containing protein n=1 Tax=Cuscuta campestris TaxID=132261 RepID=A0A484LGR0_9ASTE|nr:unnamed protein product [Cuscuta campestris]